MARKPKANLAAWPGPKKDAPGADKYFIRLWGDAAELGERAKARLAKAVAKRLGIKPEQVGFVAAETPEPTKERD